MRAKFAEKYPLLRPSNRLRMISVCFGEEETALSLLLLKLAFLGTVDATMDSAHCREMKYKSARNIAAEIPGNWFRLGDIRRGLNVVVAVIVLTFYLYLYNSA